MIIWFGSLAAALQEDFNKHKVSPGKAFPHTQFVFTLFNYLRSAADVCQ